MSTAASSSSSSSSLLVSSVLSSVKGRPKKSKKLIEISGEDLFAELVERSSLSVSSVSEPKLDVNVDKALVVKKQVKKALAEEKKQAKKALAEEKKQAKKA